MTAWYCTVLWPHLLKFKVHANGLIHKCMTESETDHEVSVDTQEYTVAKAAISMSAAALTLHYLWLKSSLLEVTNAES